MADTKMPNDASTQGGTRAQHVEAGKQSHKNDSMAASDKSGKLPGPLDQSHEQHVAAGKQSHKNDSKDMSAKSDKSAGTQGGTREQHVAAGKQSHKND